MRVAVAGTALLLGACTASETAATSGTGSASSPATEGTSPRSSSPSATTSPGEAPVTTQAGVDGLPAGRDVVVTSITDGDTFRAGDERVRLTGIDTPEVSTGPECFGPEATDAITELIPPGTEVRLVLDVEAEDRYDRTLAYVYRLSDGEFVNLALARKGFATPLSIAPNVAHADDVRAAAAEARATGRGLWSACPVDPDDIPTATVGPSQPGSTVAGGACDPSYPDVCIPPAPPDLDCADIADRGFIVLAPDPHRFDGGGDGRGCEG